MASSPRYEIDICFPNREGSSDDKGDGEMSVFDMLSDIDVSFPELEVLLNGKFFLIWMKLRFLEVVILSFEGREQNNSNSGRLKTLLFQIRTVFQDIEEGFQEWDIDFKKFSSERCKLILQHVQRVRYGQQEDMDDELLSSTRERLEILNLDVQQVYELVSFKSSSSFLATGRCITIHEDIMENLNSLLEIVEDMMKWKADLAATIKDELEATQKSLRFLRIFLRFIAKRYSEYQELKDVAEFLVRKMSCLFYLCCSVNDGMVKEIKMHLSFELHKFNPVEQEVREIYIRALKASKLAQVNYSLLMVDEFDLGFLDCLQDAILELADANKDQLLSLHEEVRLLATSIAMYKLSEEQTSNFPKQDELSNHFMEHISNVIIDMACVIYSLHNAEDDDKAKDLKVSISDLQESIKIAKEEVRKAYDTCIPKSWLLKTKFQTSNALGIRTLMRNLKKISSHGSELEDLFIKQALDHGFSPHLPRNLAEVLRQEIQSIISAFSEFTSKPQPQIEICLSDIRNRTENLISLFPLVFRNLNFSSFIIFEEINKIKMELESLRNKMMHDTSNYAEIFEDDADRLGKQLINESQEPHSLPIDADMPGIDDHESTLDSICPRKDEARALRLKASFLKVFQRCKGMWHIEDENLKVLLTRMSSGFQKADEDLQRLLSNLKVEISKTKYCCLPMNMDCLLSSVLSRFLKPAIPEVLSIVSNSSRSISGTSDEAMENLNTLLENIDALLECNAELVAPLIEEFEGVRNCLRFVRNFIGFIAKRCSKPQILKDLLIHAESLAGNISCLLYLCCCYDERMNDEIVNLMKMHFSSVLQMFNPAQADVRETYIKALKASKSEHKYSTMLNEFDLGFIDSLQDNILELSDTSLRFITFNKDQILSLQEQLKFLITFFEMDRSLEEYPEYPISNFLEAIDAVIIDTGYVIYSLNNDEKDEKLAREVNEKVSDLAASIMGVKEAARNMYDLCVPKSLLSNFPRTNAQGFISSLLGKLKELLNSKADVVAPLEHHIVMVQMELLSLREDFSKIAKHTQFKELQRQWSCFLDIAYITEFVIDSFLAKDRPLYCHKLGLFNVIEDIKGIKTELEAIKVKTTDETLADKPSCFSIQVSVDSSFPKGNVVLSSKERLADEKSMTKLVIFSEEAEKIRVQLTNGSRKLNIISIVGMPGIGKTTLADSVFQDSSLTNHFHVQARCSVSQVHDKRRLLLEILQQVATGSTQYGDADLDQRLYKSLKGRRYLILMDDVWSIQPWKDIEDSFPDDEIGSRIIFTSRFEDITTQVGLESINYRLSPLSEEKSWEMLQVKLFGNKCCPSELASLGREIATNCKGLPLTVDLVAGILREKELKEWKKVAESLMTTVFADPEGRCQKVLELSYQNLADNLKPCFLYFASFPEDANVPTRDLILLWIAEGFVQLEEGELRSLEDVAEDILKNLISRSLVMVYRRRPLGGVAASRVHDLLHEFAAAKAQEESFMLKIDGHSKFSTLSSVSVHDQWREQYRLCIYPDRWEQFVESNPSGPRTRALISSSAPLGDVFSLNFRAFKILRVLYIPKVRTHFFPEMLTLIHLRLLAIDIFDNSVAASIMSKIHELHNLESFVMDRALSSKPNVDMLLDEICNMVRLRHFCFGGYISFKYCSEKIWEMSSPFDNLRTLYNLRASYDEDVEKILKLMPNLVELKVLFYGPDKEIYPFPKFDVLKKLESLEVTHGGRSPFHCGRIVDINFPPYLKKLVLSNFQVPWTEVSIIGNLEYLEILELKNRAFKGPKWDMIDGEFPKLKYLSLYNLDIEEWNASEDHLSCLEQLCVATCRNLEDLPSCLAEMATLQVIRLFNCSLSVENSAKRIKEEQKESGNEEFLVDIY